MPMDPYQAMMQAMKEGGPAERNQATPVGWKEAEDGLHQHASGLYNQLQQYHARVEAGQPLDYEEAIHVHRLNQAFEHAMSQWEHARSQRLGENNTIQPVGDALKQNVMKGKALQQPGAGYGATKPQSLLGELDQAAAGHVPARR